MTTDREKRNALAVVQSWKRNEHLHAWNEAAHNRPPDVLMRFAAEAYQDVADEAKGAAEFLRQMGFQSGHTELRGLRDIESQARNRERRLMAWATALTEALEDDA